MLTGEQIRAARALARLEQAQLAKACSLSLETIKRLERVRGPVDANVRTLSAIIEAFERMQIRFDSCVDGGVGVCFLPRETGASPDMRALTPSPHKPESEQPLHRLVYFSRATAAALPIRSTLSTIAQTAKTQNAELGVTGALMACDGRFLQALEGGKSAVREMFGAISSDPRHCDLTILECREVSSRRFEGWALLCGLFPSDAQIIADEPALRDGFHPERLSPSGALGLLEVVRDLHLMPPRALRGDLTGQCPLVDICLDRTCANPEADRAPVPA